MSASSDSATDPSSTTAGSTTALPEATVSVNLPADLHARPAGKIAQTAARFESSVRLEYAGRSANSAGVLRVMGLSATAGSTVLVHATGPDASEAAIAVARILAEAE